jgi:hypothetical protein
LVQELNLDVRSAKGSLDREVTGGYASDLISDVLAHAEEGNLWVTLQVHQNVVAVASMKNLAAVVLVNSREPEQETTDKAEAENVVIAVTEMPTFELVGKLYNLGVTGMG